MLQIYNWYNLCENVFRIHNQIQKLFSYLLVTLEGECLSGLHFSINIHTEETHLIL